MSVLDRMYDVQAERDRLREAIKTHRSQKADDRCRFDDDVLYAALGDGVACDRRVGDKAAMLTNCARFIDQRCDAGGWPSYVELEAERDRLKLDLAALKGHSAVAGEHDAVTCPKCDGTKKVGEEECWICAGSGAVLESLAFRVRAVVRLAKLEALEEQLRELMLLLPGCGTYQAAVPLAVAEIKRLSEDVAALRQSHENAITEERKLRAGRQREFQRAEGAEMVLEAYRVHHQMFHGDCNIDGPQCPPKERSSTPTTAPPAGGEA